MPTTAKTRSLFSTKLRLCVRATALGRRRERRPPPLYPERDHGTPSGCGRGPGWRGQGTGEGSGTAEGVVTLVDGCPDERGKGVTT